MKKGYTLIPGETNKKIQTIKECKKNYAALFPIIESLAKCLKSNSIKTGELKFFKEDAKFNLKLLNNGGEKGEIEVEITGLSGNSLGMPYYSSWDGLFYRLPSNKKKPFAKNGQFVRRGRPIGVVFINKNEQFILNSPADGSVFFPEEDNHLDRGIPIKTYDQDGPKNNKPMFFLQ